MISRSKLSVVGELLIAAVDRIFHELLDIRVGVGLRRLSQLVSMTTDPSTVS